MGYAENKAARLLQIEAMLLAYPEGLAAPQIASKLGVNRSTIWRYHDDLPKHIYVDDLDDNRWKIDRDAYLVKVRFTMHEALSLHLAARLMATRTDKQNPHAAAALRKLGNALEKLAPLISQHLYASAEMMEEDARRHDPVYLEVLETLTRAWSQGKMVRLWHQRPDNTVNEYTLAPYVIEPYAVGQTAYVIGQCEACDGLRTFKVERIRRIELTANSYTIPEQFNIHTLLENAWGIWYTEEKPVMVQLRFHPRVAARVQETRWHRNEETTPQEDGSLLWQAQIAAPQEMLPWIRGWGADVEVLEPEALRSQIAEELRRAAAQYIEGK